MKKIECICQTTTNRLLYLKKINSSLVICLTKDKKVKKNKQLNQIAMIINKYLLQGMPSSLGFFFLIGIHSMQG